MIGTQERRNQLKRLDQYRTLVLNADYQPVSYWPLSTWPWQQAVKLIHEDVVTLVRAYPDITLRSAHAEHPLPSVIAFKRYVQQKGKPPFTKMNIFLRDEFTCQYCGEFFGKRTQELTFEHVMPQSRGGKTNWTNILTACGGCNLRKGDKTPKEAKMPTLSTPYEPSWFELQAKAKKYPTGHLHETWEDFLYWDTELEAG